MNFFLAHIIASRKLSKGKHINSSQNDYDEIENLVKMFWMDLLCLLALMIIYILIPDDKFNHAQVTNTQKVEITLLKISHPPKHFYCDLLDKSNNIALRNHFISKHFNDWRKLKPGSSFKAKRVTYEVVKGEWVEKFHLDKIPIINNFIGPDYPKSIIEYEGLYEGLYKSIK